MTKEMLCGMVTYIQPIMDEIAKDQNKVIYNGTDFSVLSVFLCRSPHLKKFMFQYMYPLDSLKDWRPIRERETGLRSIKQSFDRHFRASFHAMRLGGMVNPIRSLEISNAWQDLDEHNHELFQEVLRSVYELHLHDAHIFKTVAKHINTPLLRSFKVSSTDILHLETLKVFCKKNCQHLCALHLRCLWFQDQKNGQEYGAGDAPSPFLQDFYKIGKMCLLEEVSVYTLPHSYDDLEMDVLEKLLLRQVKEADLVHLWKKPSFLI
ncbi:hypothetical protein ETB97_007786 [Aspergillus alliaceus]|uniref:Uncharacterized protein n=1 Tax=Petromyces alliaceus TaxID=209559 RepID=A0A8H5ZW43_PETAA|nr:hypothetical protein ETB97_007786 [Aspergillus burnettii]